MSELRLQFAGETARLEVLCLAPSGVLIGVEIKTGDAASFATDTAEKKSTATSL